MRVLKKEALNDILSEFNFDGELIFKKNIKYEPDCYIYFFVNKNEDRYALICRDLVQDDFAAEKRILKKELNMEIIDRAKTKSRAYWLKKANLDDFEYVFSLIKYIQA